MSHPAPAPIPPSAPTTPNISQPRTPASNIAQPVAAMYSPPVLHTAQATIPAPAIPKKRGRPPKVHSPAVVPEVEAEPSPKRPRGRPRGSKNRPKEGLTEEDSPYEDEDGGPLPSRSTRNASQAVDG